MSGQHQDQRQGCVPQVDAPEPFRTMREVADITQLPYYQIIRAVKASLIPHHRLGTSSKKYLRMSEVLAAVERHGGET